jgi:hypothetical protein
VSSAYRFSAVFAVRVLGAACTAVGLLVVALVVVAALIGPGSMTGAGLLVVALSATLGLLVLGVLAVRRPVAVTFDENGYRVRLVRGAGRRQAPWTEVEDAAADVVAGVRCVVVRLRDGGTTTIPVEVLAGRPDDFVRDLQRHLDAGHGYRRVPPRAG